MRHHASTLGVALLGLNHSVGAVYLAGAGFRRLQQTQAFGRTCRLSRPQAGRHRGR